MHNNLKASPDAFLIFWFWYIIVFMKKNYTKEQLNTLIVVLLTAFLTTFTGNALNLSIPAIEIEFDSSAKTVGWVMTLYTLICAGLAVPFGKVADSINRKKVFWLGISIFAVGSFASVFSWSLGALLLFRGIQAVGAAMIFATNMAILVGAFDQKERGKVLGISTCATYVGLSSGPVIGGVLNQHFGWKSILIVSGAIALIALYLAITKIKEEKPENNFKGLDYKGTGLFCAGITALMYGISTIGGNTISYGITLGGVALLIIFFKYEVKVQDPVIKVSMFKNNKAFLYSNLAALMNYGATFAITYLLSMYLQMTKDFSSQAAGLVLITAPLVQAILSPLAGKLSDKHSPFKLSSAGMGVCAVGLGILIFLKVETPLWLIIGTLVLTGIGFALFSSPNTNAIMSAVKKEDYSVASSILATMRSVGHTISMAIVTLVVGIFMGDNGMNQVSNVVMMDTVRTCFIVFCIVSVVGIFISLKRK